MKNEELNEFLRRAAPPERPVEYWNDFPAHVTRELNRARSMRRPARSAVPRLAWAMAIALGCVLAGYLIGQNSGNAKVASGNNGLLQNKKFIQELTAMFPDRVRAIVKDESGVQLILSDEPNIPKSVPIWVKICRGQSCTTIVTFSGQELEIAGQNLTVLTDADNRVILAGERFAWTSTGDGRITSDLKIQARPLEFALR
jgi:hypothetical protein